MTVAFNKLQPFVERLAEKSFNLGSDSMKLALTNTAPSASHAQLSDLTEIAYTNLSSRAVTISTSAQTSGTYKLVCADVTLTSSGGSTGPFRYVYLYDDTATNDELVGYWDYGSALTLADGESIVVDFDGTTGVLQLA